MERRRFIVKAGGVLAAVGAAAVVDAPSVIAQPKVQWRPSDHAAGVAQVYGRSEYEGKHVALEKLEAEFKAKVEIIQPAPVLRDLKKLAAEVVKAESEKSPMAKKVYASYTKFQAQHTGWSHVAEGAYQQFVAL